MNDIANELLELLKKDYEKEVSENKTIQLILKKTKEGTADYTDSLKFAKEIGNCVEKAFTNNISDETLPDSKMYYDLAKALIEPMCKENYKTITAHCAAIQTSLNKRANIGLQAIKPEYNKEKTEGIINYISSANKYSEREQSFLDSLSTNAKAIVDESVKQNAEFHYQAGLSPKIVRTPIGKTCKWCQEVAGVYEYGKVKNTGNVVFRRHANCDCTVVYDPSDGSKKIQDVWSKRIDYKKNIEKHSNFMGAKKPFNMKLGRKNISFVTYKNDKYTNIYCQTYSQNSKKLCEYLNTKINQEHRYGEVNNIIIVKYSALQGIACYDHINNDLFICEELISDKFSQIVDSSYFPSKSIDDVLDHELGGHKVHWEVIKKYQQENNVNEMQAKEAVEEKLRNYVLKQKINDIMYIKKNVSQNAEISFRKTKSLNELIADCFVLHRQNNIYDVYLDKLVMEVLNYDG